MMKLINILVLFLAMSFNNTYAQSEELVKTCALDIGNAVYLKDFKANLPANGTKKFNVIMNKGTMYKISVCNAKGQAGQAVVKLMENVKLLGTNLKSDGSFVGAVGFQCTKTGMYTINVTFKDGKPGAAVAILSYLDM